MDGIHDLGGRQGYGPIDVNEPPEPFHAPWEARLFGITRAFTRPAMFSIAPSADWLMPGFTPTVAKALSRAGDIGGTRYFANAPSLRTRARRSA